MVLRYLAPTSRTDESAGASPHIAAAHIAAAHIAAAHIAAWRNSPMKNFPGTDSSSRPVLRNPAPALGFRDGY